MYPQAHETFLEEIKKIKANYGEQHFSDQMASMIWGELKDFSPKQIRSVFAIAIKENEFAPKMNVFYDLASRLREKIRQFDREQERQDAKDFWAGTYHTEDVKMIVRTIKDRMEGKCDDNTWREFQQLLKTTADHSEPVKCKKCEDTGVYFDSQTRAFKCHHPVRPILKPQKTFTDKSHPDR